ncbi:serine hydrolase domain-containing protein [Sphingobium sp. SYK-6]|uniref:serine hydrolase domain-containing protein n=1 Tax=Sphingobium sp. (strain NBRC 103272 / SYK-6) TaxID=627192 RepID=UPI000685C54F|nr:serine hydrolase domain-containing protein [Sphingobium sp. SYK-6]
MTCAAAVIGGLMMGMPGMAQTPAPTSVAAPSQDELRARADGYMRAAVAHDQFTGAVLVARDGVPLIDTAYGMASHELGVPNTPETVYHVASLTKQFTAMVIIQLRDRGKLEVGDPICTYLADCPAAWKPITIRHLLTHSSGIPNVSSLPDWDDELSLKRYTRAEFVDLFRALPLEFTPGEKYSYSNSGYFLLGLIIERVSGSAFDQFLKANIFTPLGMTHSGYDDNRAVIPGAATGYYSRGTDFITATYVDPSTRLGDTGIVSTTGDLLRWDQALYTEKLVSRQSLDEIFTPYRNGYGYGWEIGTRFGRRTVAHSGSDGGFSSYILRFPDDRLTVIVLGNGDRMSAAKAAVNLSAITLGAPYKMPAPQLRDALWDVVIQDGVPAALARFDQARQQIPPLADANGDTLLDLGYDLVDGRRLAEADAIFRAGLQRFPDLVYAWDGLADSASARGDRPAAIGFFEHSLKLDPANDYAVRGLAKLRRMKSAAP